MREEESNRSHESLHQRNLDGKARARTQENDEFPPPPRQVFWLGNSHQIHLLSVGKVEIKSRQPVLCGRTDKNPSL